MIKLLYALVLGILTIALHHPVYSQGSTTPSLQPMIIDQNDTVFFDIAQATVLGSMVEFPVYLKSDDLINALDFAFKYDQTHLLYDSIINLTSYIDPLSYYNTNDSTVRFTSYSFSQPYSNDTPLVKIRFTLLSGQLCATDIDSISALLNGDASGLFVTDCTSSLEEYGSEVNINLFPIPANETIHIGINGIQVIGILDLSGKLVSSTEYDTAVNQTALSVSSFPPGTYLIKITGKDFIATRKFIVVP